MSRNATVDAAGAPRAPRAPRSRLGSVTVSPSIPRRIHPPQARAAPHQPSLPFHFHHYLITASPAHPRQRLCTPGPSAHTTTRAPRFRHHARHTHLQPTASKLLEPVKSRYSPTRAPHPQIPPCPFDSHIHAGPAPPSRPRSLRPRLAQIGTKRQRVIHRYGYGPREERGGSVGEEAN